VSGSVRNWFCPRCGSILRFTRTESGLFFKCPKCGYEGLLPAQVTIEHDEGLGRPIIRTDLRSPELGYSSSALGVVMRFYYQPR